MRRYAGCLPTLGNWESIPPASPLVARAREGGLSAGLALLTRDRGEMPHLFLEEDLEYARRLMLAGVPTELHVYPGAFHGFNMVAGANVSQSALRDQLDALRRAFSRS